MVCILCFMLCIYRLSYTFAPESFEEIEDIDTLNISRLSVDRI